MKSPGVIYRQYRDTRKLAMIRALSAARSPSHENCFYGRLLECDDVCGHCRTIRLCLYREGDPDVCTNPGQCNAFVRRWSDQEVVDKFREIMENSSIKKKLFPELWAYEWVLDKSLTEALKEPKGFLSRLVVWAIAALESLLKSLNKSKSIINGSFDGKT